MLFCLIRPLFPTYTSGVLRSVGVERQTYCRSDKLAATLIWASKRNCSITPKQLVMVYLILSSVSVSIAIVFTMQGAWYVLGFALLEMAAVGAAFLHFGRHALDRECLELTDCLFIVKLTQAGKESSFELNPNSARVILPHSRNALIGIEDGLVKIKVGRFLSHAKRQEFAAKLRRSLPASR